MPPRIDFLAVTRPVFRGLRRLPPGAVGGGVDAVCLAVTRPVFRGLRHDRVRRGLNDRHLPHLAVTRPVFRGLRQDPVWHQDPPGGALLAVTRPVFRGLRPVQIHAERAAEGKAACSDETRFQGIATMPS